jgi:hypothetical protein
LWRSRSCVIRRDTQNQRERRKTVVFSAWQDNVIIDLYVSAFIAYSWGDFVVFNPVNNRA